MTDTVPRPLEGFTVGVTAERRRDELRTALERQGARVVVGTAIRVVPLADDSQLLDATKRLVERPPDFTIATTGVGFRGWLEVAGQWGLAEPLLDAVRRSVVLTRGPKVRGAVRAAGLRETWSPASESSDEVFEHLLASYEPAGTVVAVQLHGDPLRDLLDAVRAAGAEVVEIPVYRWEPPADEEPLFELITAVCARSVDAVTFTSAPAATNFLRTADARGQGDDLRAAFADSVSCFAVGPVTGAPLVAAGIEVVAPERFRLGALVREIAERLPERRLGSLAAQERDPAGS